MKKPHLFFTVCLALALSLTACGAAPTQAAARTGAPAETVPEESAANAPEDPEPSHVHQPSRDSNVVAHEPAGYCGNTVTTVSRETCPGSEPWEASFWGDDSVALTDLLRYLDYSGDVCKCLPEYYVDTEFGTGYGVNLTEGYARYDGRQTDLTEEQAALIQEILNRQAPQP